MGTKKKTPARSKPTRRAPPRATADELAKGQREISVSEFFAKNRHLLGFDNPRKALLTSVKEAVDNALDACEEAGILPDVTVKVEDLEPDAPATKDHRFRLTVLDNGPGIVRKQVENIFGKLLYGSKFHRLKMSRGQQGIGISAAGMYGLMTTGRPMVINTRPSRRRKAHHIELAMDTTKNKPEVSVDVETDEFPPTSSGTGTQVAIEMLARYVRGKTSVEAYLEQTAIANPHAQITFFAPKQSNAEIAEDDAEDAKQNKLLVSESESEHNSSSATSAQLSEPSALSSGLIETKILPDRIIYPRTVDELPEEPKEIKPHPYGVELGTFLTKLKQTDEKALGGFLSNEFSRVTPAVAKDIYKAATTSKKTVTGQTRLTSIDHAAAERIYKALQEAKLRAPPTDCLSPIGVRQLLAGMLKGVKAEFYAASTRSPAVYRGNPFQIEVAMAFGGDLPGDQPARVIRFANRVPLLYQQSACCAFKSVVDTAWRSYAMSQPKGSLPVGPLVIMIHMASVWVPFTSESKEAIADYDEIRKEMKLALQDCGRKLGTYLRRRQKMRREGERRDVFERYIGEIAKACHALNGVDAVQLYDALLRQAKRRTEVADAQLDEEGQFIKDNGRLDKDDTVVIVDRDNDEPPPPLASTPPEPRPSGSGPDATPRKGRTTSKKKSATKTKQPTRQAPRKKTRTSRKAASKPIVRITLAPSPTLFSDDLLAAAESTS